MQTADEIKLKRKLRRSTPAFKAAKRKWRQKPRTKMIRAAKRRLAKHIKTYTMSLRIDEMLGCSPDFYCKWIESKFAPGMTWDNYGQWHVDHIKPLAFFNLEDPEQQKLCFHYSNVQPLWSQDNYAKWERDRRSAIL